ncbi:hypothetical protein [Vibrio campbellii]|uniref:hypothetical protein n=1 Tax=Vibrio campbellii TaxID=680 RepID=UPI0021088512|nr:hypothetical protein [Vibrio campbellii]UTZ44549.1 hypothetical protein HB764_25140 [Vibrio campbellii]
MTPAQRVKNRKLCLAKKRQQRCRLKRTKQELLPLQVQISRYAHSKARMVCELQGISLTELYQLAINNTSTDNPPKPHLEVMDGDLVGSIRISPWISKDAHEYFYKELLPNYTKSRTAISAIVSAYCDSVLL